MKKVFRHLATGRNRLPVVFGATLMAIGLLAPSVAVAQTFNSGSNGSDGALTVATNQGTILFDPRDVARWGRVLDPDGDGVYHFTTVTVGGGTTLKFTSRAVSTAIHWLATGDIAINGALDLNGEDGAATSDLVLRRIVAVPGSGGYAGGIGGRIDVTPNVPTTPGEGPGGGSGGVRTGNGCGTNGVSYYCGRGATFTGNRYLIPLVGGSGGEGGTWNTYQNGGAGGGAILLASSTSITVVQGISARGGNTVGPGGGGGGGMIRLVAPTLSGSAGLNVLGGTNTNGYSGSGGESGWVRLEGFQVSTGFTFSAGSARVTRGSPVDTTSLQPSGTVRVTAVAGVAIPVYPSGTFALPDVTINAANPVDVAIQATGIPPGTVVTLHVYPDTPEVQTTVNLPPVQTTLQGTLELSTATVQFAFPYGFSRGYVRATWTQ